MKPGIYDGLSFADYCSIPAINKSGLDELERSPLHYWSAYLDPKREPRKETPAMRLGTAIHTAVLEPKRFAEEYRAMPEPCDFPTALNVAEDYKEACRKMDLKVSGTKDELKERLKSAGFTGKFFDDIALEFARYKLLTVKEMMAASRISANLHNSSAAKIVLAAGKSEQTLVWKDPSTGVLCKGRCDWLTNDYEVIDDFKSAMDASQNKFSKSCSEYQYHRQAAWYLDGLKILTGKNALFVLPVYETAPPYAGAFYHATDRMVAQGRRENRILVDRYAECLKKNEWPGYPDELQPIDVPAWRRDDSETKNEKHALEMY